MLGHQLLQSSSGDIPWKSPETATAVKTRSRPGTTPTNGNSRSPTPEIRARRPAWTRNPAATRTHRRRDPNHEHHAPRRGTREHKRRPSCMRSVPRARDLRICIQQPENPRVQRGRARRHPASGREPAANPGRPDPGEPQQHAVEKTGSLQQNGSRPKTSLSRRGITTRPQIRTCEPYWSCTSGSVSRSS